MTPPFWNQRDIDTLLTHAGRIPMREVAAMLTERRTAEACRRKWYDLRPRSERMVGIPVQKAACVLRVDRHMMRTWEALGLRMSEGAAVGLGRVQAIQPADLAAFLIGRPEFCSDLQPRRLRELGVDPDPLMERAANARFKRSICHHGELHASEQDVIFWAPCADRRVNCPACGRPVSATAYGDEVGRYTWEQEEIPAVDRMSRFDGMVLSEIATGRWHSGRQAAREFGTCEEKVRDAVKRLIELRMVSRVSDLVLATPEGARLAEKISLR